MRRFHVTTRSGGRDVASVHGFAWRSSLLPTLTLPGYVPACQNSIKTKSAVLSTSGPWYGRHHQSLRVSRPCSEPALESRLVLLLIVIENQPLPFHFLYHVFYSYGCSHGEAEVCLSHIASRHLIPNTALH